LGFSFTSCSDGGGAQHIRWGQSSPVRLVFGLSKAHGPYMLSAPVDLGPMGAHTRGSELGRLQASSKTVNSVITTGSNRADHEVCFLGVIPS
jgi:hypothetical protein